MNKKGGILIAIQQFFKLTYSLHHGRVIQNESKVFPFGDSFQLCPNVFAVSLDARDYVGLRPVSPIQAIFPQSHGERMLECSQVQALTQEAIRYYKGELNTVIG